MGLTRTSIYNPQTVTRLAVCTCCKCGIVFGMPTEFDEFCLRDKTTFYCPNGHGQSYSRSKEDDLKRQLEWARGDLARARERVAEESRRASAFKGVATKLRKRAEAGVCAHCNRTFQNVAKHMQSKHGDILGHEATT